MPLIPPPSLQTHSPDTRNTIAAISAENQQLKESLQRSETRFTLLTESLPALIAYFDAQQTYRYSNQHYAQRFGRSISAVLGATIVDVIGERGYTSVKHHIDRALAGETVTHEYAMRQEGKIVHGRSTLVPELNQTGEVLGCFVLSFDTTEQKNMQEALVHAQKMEAIGQLTGGIAHDFNNLLTIVIGNLTMIEDRLESTSAFRELVTPAMQAAQRGVELIRHLLSFSRQQPLKPVSLNIVQMIEDMTPLIRQPLPSSIQFQRQFPSMPLYTRADRGQLESALLNLVLNARDAMPEGGVLAVTARPCDHADLLPHDGPQNVEKYHLIEVSDTGTGMNAETLSRVFEPFFTTKNFGRGNGLGLAMVYGFIKQSGGGINVQSEIGKGTTFQLVLPATKEDVPTHQSEPEDLLEASLPGVHHGRLVLLVEDEPAVRTVVRNQLLDLGHPVIEAENSRQAIEMLTQLEDIEILLTDVVMPGDMNGRDLARHALYQRPDLHIILMSGYEEQTNEKPSDMPQLQRLCKPFAKRELAMALK